MYADEDISRALDMHWTHSQAGEMGAFVGMVTRRLGEENGKMGYQEGGGRGEVVSVVRPRAKRSSVAHLMVPPVLRLFTHAQSTNINLPVICKRVHSSQSPSLPYHPHRICGGEDVREMAPRADTRLSRRAVVKCDIQLAVL